MRKRQQRFSTPDMLMQIRNEQVSLSKGYCYVRATTGFAAPDSYRDGRNNSDKTRPWFDR